MTDVTPRSLRYPRAFIEAVQLLREANSERHGRWYKGSPGAGWLDDVAALLARADIPSEADWDAMASKEISDIQRQRRKRGDR
jgi:hypothetical protein